MEKTLLQQFQKLLYLYMQHVINIIFYGYFLITAPYSAFNRSDNGELNENIMLIRRFSMAVTARPRLHTTEYTYPPEPVY